MSLSILDLRPWCKFVLAISICCAAGSFANADIAITYGTIEGATRYIDLFPNTPNQDIEFFAVGVAADGGTDGLELDMQVGDGGAANGGTDTGPTLGTVDLIGGTIWAGSGPTQNNTVSNPLLKQSTVDTGSLVNVDGLIATIQFDTTGISSGEIDFRLTGVAGSFDSSFFRGGSRIGTSVGNAVIRIGVIPEPSAVFVLGSLTVLGVLPRRRRKPNEGPHGPVNNPSG